MINTALTADRRHSFPQRALALAVVSAAVGLAGLTGCQTDRGRVATPPPTEEQREARIARAEVAVTAARTAQAAGDYANALVLFREILAENPLLTDAYLGIGDVHVAQGNFELAEPAYSRAARLEPQNFDAHFGHGYVLQQLRRFVEALRAYQRALTIQPESFETNSNMAAVYLELGEPSSALVYAERAVRTQPDNAEARRQLGTALEGLGRSAEAIEQLEISLELAEPTPELLLRLVNAYGNAQRFDEAANTAIVLVRQAPSAEAYERLGWAYFRLGRYEQSIAAYRDAVRLDGDHWPALNGVGVNALNAWLLSERTDARAADEARVAFRRSLRLNQDQPRVVRLLTTYQL